MTDLTPEDGWFSAFFDGEGYVKAGVIEADDRNVGYTVAPALRVKHAYIAGIMDSEGTMGTPVFEMKKLSTGYHIYPMTKVYQNTNDRLMAFLAAYAQSRDVKYSIREVERSDKVNDQHEWAVYGAENVEGLLSPIRDLFIVKSEQVEILLDELIPYLKSGRHTTKKGFLEVMESVDRLNSYKGHNRGKYNLEYFEELWEMEL